jgi:hypothetical protein
VLKFLIDECLTLELVEIARLRGFTESSHIVWLGKAGWKDWELKAFIVDGRCGSDEITPGRCGTRRCGDDAGRNNPKGVEGSGARANTFQTESILRTAPKNHNELARVDRS